MKSFPLEPLKVTVGTGLGTFGTTVIGNGKTYGAAYAELVRPWGGDGEYGSMWQVAAGVPRSSPERPRAEAWMKALAAEWGPPIGERNGMIILREVRGRDGAYAVVMYKGATLQVFWTEGGAQLAQSFCR